MIERFKDLLKGISGIAIINTLSVAFLLRWLLSLQGLVNFHTFNEEGNRALAVLFLILIIVQPIIIILFWRRKGIGWLILNGFFYYLIAYEIIGIIHTIFMDMQHPEVNSFRWFLAFHIKKLLIYIPFILLINLPRVKAEFNYSKIARIVCIALGILLAFLAEVYKYMMLKDIYA